MLQNFQTYLKFPNWLEMSLSALQPMSLSHRKLQQLLSSKGCFKKQFSSTKNILKKSNTVALSKYLSQEL